MYEDVFPFNGGIFMAITAAVNTVIFLAAAVFSIVAVVAVCFVFRKANEHPLWGIIPVANIYKLYKIAFGNGWFFLLLFLPLVNVFIGIMLCVYLAKAFGKDGLFALGLLLLNPIFMCILAFGDARYIGPKGERTQINDGYVGSFRDEFRETANEAADTFANTFDAFEAKAKDFFDKK